ncbi:MAG: glycosyltransferase involved in cell wall biosynthesis, partial [Saprospiraceae bacterium]
GVVWVPKPFKDIDIYHSYTGTFNEVFEWMGEAKIPFVKTCHIDRELVGGTRKEANKQWIYVSKSLAKLYNSERYIHCGLDPEEYIYSETKEDYFLIISSMERYEEKGLDIALKLSKKRNFKLVVAGTAKNAATIAKVKAMCKTYQADYVGDVRGMAKAELYAGAKAILFPTRQEESFGLVMVEAMFSGTPVICSDKGACPEIISPEVGFVCSNEADYLYAIDHVEDVLPKNCLAKAMKDYHYQRMADEYLIEYEKEISIGKSIFV